MGVTNLLNVLSSKKKKRNIGEFKNKTLGVDAFSWLHKSLYCFKALPFSGIFENDIQMIGSSPLFLNYLRQKVEMFKNNQVDLVFVFDTKAPKIKNDVLDRNGKRSKIKSQFIKPVEFKTAEIRKKYVNKLIESLRIDDSMVDQTKEFLDSNNIKYILAPLEADPQLAYLRNANKIDAIVTEDSDLLVYKCDNILTKLDNKGDCDEYNYSDVDLGLDNYNNFVYFCILSGCDYFKMHMVGPKKAMNIVKEANEEYNKKLRFGTSQNFSELEKEILNFNSVVNAVKFEDKKNEPKGKNSKNIEVDFAKAYITFLQNLVKGENDEILNVNAKTEFINFLYKKYDLDNSFYM